MLLDIQNLKTHFFVRGQVAKAVDDVSFSVHSGQTIGLVGESGCGKSVTAHSIIQLIPEPPGKIVGGKIFFDGTDLLELSERQMRRIRGNRISMIFQEPMTSLNPVFRIGDQITETLRLHRGLNRKEAMETAAELLNQVGIPEARQRLREHPHQLSGGLRQRVVIAMALACNPQLLIADEPTTALDVTIQAQIMDLLLQLQSELGMATLLISHDLGVVAESADRVAIMYAGLIVETATTKEIFANPLHPYTRGLLDCIPRLGEKRDRLVPIIGQVPNSADLPVGCAFAERCPVVENRCREQIPGLHEISPGHWARCWRCT